MSCEPAEDRRDEIIRLGDQIRGAWRALEDRGFPPEAAGWPFIEPDLGAAIGAALDCLIQTREDLIRQRDARPAHGRWVGWLGRILHRAPRPISSDPQQGNAHRR